MENARSDCPRGITHILQRDVGSRISPCKESRSKVRSRRYTAHASPVSSPHVSAQILMYLAPRHQLLCLAYVHWSELDTWVMPSTQNIGLFRHNVEHRRSPTWRPKLVCPYQNTVTASSFLVMVQCMAKVMIQPRSTSSTVWKGTLCNPR